MKTCNKCFEELTDENHYGRNALCKSCYNKRRKMCSSYKLQRIGKKELLTDLQKMNIIELYNEHHKMTSISRTLEIPYNIVYKYLKAFKE